MTIFPIITVLVTVAVCLRMNLTRLRSTTEERMLKIFGCSRMMPWRGIGVHAMFNWEQCDRIGRFLQVFATNCLTNVAQIFWWLLGLFLIMSLLRKNVWLLFWAIFEGNLAAFYSIIWSHWLVTSSLCQSECECTRCVAQIVNKSRAVELTF